MRFSAGDPIFELIGRHEREIAFLDDVLEQGGSYISLYPILVSLWEGSEIGPVLTLEAGEQVKIWLDSVVGDWLHPCLFYSGLILLVPLLAKSEKKILFLT